MGPLSFRKFKGLVEDHGCKVERTKKDFRVVDAEGNFVSSFAVTHGKRVRRNEVKPAYIQAFLSAMQETRG